MKNVPAAKVVNAAEASESPLPPKIQEALAELVGAAREGLLALGELMSRRLDDVRLAVMMISSG